VMNTVAEKLLAGEKDFDELVAVAETELNNSGFRADDIQIRDADTLQEASATSTRLVILMAAWLGQARLIDNKIVEIK